MYNEKIELFRVRSFSEKLNVTIEFVRQNIEVLGKAVLYFLGPLTIFSTILTYNFLKDVNTALGSLQQDTIPDNPFRMIFTPSYYGLLLFSAFGSALILSLVYNFIAIYHDKYPEKITLKEVWDRAWRDIPHVLLLGFLAICMVMLGFFFLIIPGIYLFVVLSLVWSAYVFERKNYLDSIRRSFYLIRNKWWSTFGIMIMSGIIAYVIVMIFTIPYYVLNFIKASVLVSPTGLNYESMPLWYRTIFIVALLVMQLGSYFCQIIPLTAIAFQYFNLVERQESKGLLHDIEHLESSNDNSPS